MILVPVKYFYLPSSSEGRYTDGPRVTLAVGWLVGRLVGHERDLWLNGASYAYGYH